MTVFRDEANGSYFVSFYLKDPDRKGKYRHITKRGFSTKKEASRWERDNADKPLSTDKPSFIDICKRWEVSIQASAGTIRQHREHFNIRFNQYKDIPIDKISKEDLIDWRIWLAQQPFSTKTKNTTIAYVKGVLRYAAVTYDIPDYSPILTKLKKSDMELMGEPEIWTPDEFSKFINCVEDGCYHLYFEFLYWTGCRRGEAIALQKKDLKDGSIPCSCALCRKSLEIRAFSYFGLDFELEIGHVRMIFEPGVSQLKHGF